ncbi:I78 family peptidase inhibitor [Sphingomonas dokdonensis]|uniref:Peptidase inhibitor I78 family protein n=1 Tax=Sphingomonas dokdonensis TaxID=344880 RepID=A0A245ZW71_9SPHN|nr:I78 family peptidase inhibitor [Sphingomonas dokdonensis]OWK34003.1 peptidase inhibitor I78 family protein [Sphingomonas dokdonensis]
MKAIVAAAVMLAGCTTMDDATSATPAPAACNAAAVQDLLGKSATTVQAAAKQRAGAALVRTYESGSPVTMDYRADRLNIETDAGGTIVKLSCG